jgi:membrane-associated protease RseP (regulator of RpoE activity)
MVSNALKALPLVILLALPAASLSGDESQEKNKKNKRTETRVVVDGDEVFSSDGDDPFVVRLPRRSRGYLGLRLLEMTPELRAHYGAPKDAGVLVSEVVTGSPAEKAGVHVGDIVTRADGDRIESPRDLSRAARDRKAGDTLKLQVTRDRANRELPVKVEERSIPEMDLGDLGRELRLDIGRDIGRNIGHDMGRHAWVLQSPENLEHFRERLEELDKRLKDLEKKLR